jgi:hypothetical protein
MKYTQLIILITLVFLCCRRNTDQHQSSVKSDSVCSFSFDSVSGYSFDICDNDIVVTKNRYYLLTASLFTIDSAYLVKAHKIDSNDMAKGFIIARALEGPPFIGEVGDCWTDYSIDSLWEYFNKYNTRCIGIRVKGISKCDTVFYGTSYYQEYFVDLSRGNTYQHIEIPSLELWGNNSVSELSQILANNIKLHY